MTAANAGCISCRGFDLATDAELSRWLEIDPGAPVVVVWRVTSNEQDEVLEFVRSVYRGDAECLGFAEQALCDLAAESCPLPISSRPSGLPLLAA